MAVIALGSLVLLIIRHKKGGKTVKETIIEIQKNAALTEEGNSEENFSNSENSLEESLESIDD